MKSKHKNAVFLLFVYFSIFQTLNSSWVTSVLHIPSAVSKIVTALVYLPFVLAVGYKALGDIKQIKTAFSKVSNWIYYALGVYYAAVTVWRLTTGREVQENLYFAIIFFGAVAMFMLLRDGHIRISKQELEKNLLYIAAFFIAYRLAYVLVGCYFFEKSPINVNLTTGIVAFLLPFVANMLTHTDKKKSVFHWCVLCAGLAVVATSGSRALFALTGVTMAVMLAVLLFKRKGVLRFVTAMAVGCAIVVALMLANVGQVRYAVYRQTGVDFEALVDSFETRPPQLPTEAPTGAPTEAPTEAPTDAPSEAPTEEPTEMPTSTPVGVSPEQDKTAAQEQIEASNWMRKRLTQRGIYEIEKNVLFGTGNVLYNYQLGPDYVVVQSSHNFVIEGLICFGAIGFVMIAALFIALLIEAKAFTKLALKKWNHTAVLWLSVGFYFAFGFVQPTVFDVFFCPLFLMLITAFRNAVNPTTEG